MDEIEVIIHMTWIDWLIVVVYLSGMLAIGFYFSGKTKSFEDYFLASKGITMPLLIGTLVSTFYGLDTLFGTSEIGFMEGVAGFFCLCPALYRHVSGSSLSGPQVQGV